MLTSIFSAVCALALSASPVTTPADTIQVYLLNGEKVAHFDGSQLVGKVIKEYRIGIATNNATGEVSKVHLIKTTNYDLPFKLNGDYLPGKCVICVVDGAKTSLKNFLKVKQENIGTMTVCKAGSKEAMEWTDDGNTDVLKFETKKKARVYAENIYIVDGKEVTSKEFTKLKPKDIASMTIYKAGSKEALKWSGSKEKSVIVVDRK